MMNATTTRKPNMLERAQRYLRGEKGALKNSLGESPPGKDVHIVVHPGYAPADWHAFENHDYDDPIVREWQDYVASLGETIDEASRKGDEILVIHGPARQSYAETLLEEYTEEDIDPTYIASELRSGAVRPEHFDDLKAELGSVGSSGQIHMHGELNLGEGAGCPHDTKDHIERISAFSPFLSVSGDEIQDGELYPEEPP